MFRLDTTPGRCHTQLMMQHFSFTSVALASAMLLFPVSAHAQECTSDADCEEGYGCEMNSSSMADCPPGVPCDAIEPVSGGMCEPEPFTCDTDADCPTPALCNDRGECVFHFEVCEIDTECGAGYVCTQIASGSCSVDPGSNDVPPTAGDLPGSGSGSSSSGSGSSDSGGGSSGSAGDADPLPARDLPLLPEEDSEGSEPQDKPPEGNADPKESSPLAPDAPSSDDPRIDPAEPPPDAPDQGVDERPIQCEPRDVRVCLPAPVSCTSDADCLPDWQCVEVPPGGPESWDGVEQACFPPGLIAAIDGRVKTEGGGSAEDANDAVGENPVRGEDGLGGDDDGVGGGEILEPPTAELGTQGGSEGSSGCHVAAPAHAPRTGWLGFAIGLGLLLGLRRRR